MEGPAEAAGAADPPQPLSEGPDAAADAEGQEPAEVKEEERVREPHEEKALPSEDPSTVVFEPESEEAVGSEVGEVEEPESRAAESEGEEAEQPNDEEAVKPRDDGAAKPKGEELEAKGEGKAKEDLDVKGEGEGENDDLATRYKQLQTRYAEVQRQLDIALKRIGVLEQKEFAKKHVGNGRNGNLNPSSEENKVFLLPFRFPVDSPYTRKIEGEQREAIRGMAQTFKNVQEKSDAFCKSCEVLAESSKEFAYELENFEDIKVYLPRCVFPCTKMALSAVSKLGELIGNVQIQIQEIFSKDLMGIVDEANNINRGTKELLVLRESYESALSAYLENAGKIGDVGGNKETNSDKVRSSQTKKSIEPGSQSPSKKERSFTSSSRRGILHLFSRERRSSSVSRRRSSSPKKKAIQRLNEEMVRSRREQYELLRFSQVSTVDQFLKGRMADFADSCIAVFQFINTFFKHGSDLCNGIEPVVFLNRTKVGSFRELLNDERKRIDAGFSQFKSRLKDNPFSQCSMHELRKGITAFQSPDDLRRVSLVSRASSIADSEAEKGLREKEGYLFKKGQGIRKAWGRRWFYLKEDNLYYVRSKKDLRPNFVANLVLAAVKEMKNCERPYTIVLTNPQGSREYLLQAESEADMESWIKALKAVAERRLYAQSPRASHKRTTDRLSQDLPLDGKSQRSINIKTKPVSKTQLLRQINLLNRHCADCGKSRPDWALINFGVCVCIECSGVHRGLGVQVSKVRSLKLDKWDLPLLRMMCKLGFSAGKSIFEGGKETGFDPVKPAKKANRETREVFIRAKYVDKKFMDKKRAYSESKSTNENRAQLLWKSAVEATTRDDVESLLYCIASGLNLKLCISEGDSKNHKTITAGDTLLHIAGKCGALTSAELILIYGADPNTKNAEGKTPLDCTRDHQIQTQGKDYDDLIERLVECTSEFN
eukprot:CAMPEP_0114500756 /NCGR_PEP_ID=MMETSP0109-20121206/8133_1 /TAXON_ID=29199 /ORGANISM="Chlorarachnion reptans, Strain CCCM449" /LENGTH=940 /DNA_ID=CAMNT_0001678437 /DNA_START=78 /DNA_END=2900 /DNA_ORIENTATION=-